MGSVQLINAEVGPSPGWYTDPAGRHESRWWDGTSWRNAVLDQGVRSDDPLAPSTPGGDPGTAERLSDRTNKEDDAVAPVTVIPAEVPNASGTKISMFNAKKVATELQVENQRLRSRGTLLENIVREFGGLEPVALQEKVSQLRAHVDATREEVDSVLGELAQARVELELVQQHIIVSRDRIELEERGLFDYEHVAEASASLATQLESVRSEIKSLNKYDRALHAAKGFTFNNSQAKGRTFVNQMSRIMLRAYNAEAENAVKTVKAGNLQGAQRRLSRAQEQIEKQGTMIDLAVDARYHGLRLSEIELAARHLQALAAEKAQERARREELREQKKAEQELRREKERLEKERTHYVNSIERLRAAGEMTAADELADRLASIDDEIAQADYRAANVRAGYVYVISNVGAFGEGIVKIGMTRRLEPMDRVRELGDASVPFTFDVHALFFADDAVGIEAALHREFAPERINQVNPRKEFFRASPSAVLQALTKHRVSVLEFRTEADAEEFRRSQAIREGV